MTTNEKQGSFPLFLFKVMIVLTSYSFISLLLEQYRVHLPLFSSKYNSLINFVFLIFVLILLLLNNKASKQVIYAALFSFIIIITTFIHAYIYQKSFVIVLLFAANALFGFSILAITHFASLYNSNRGIMGKWIKVFAVIVLLTNMLFLIRREVRVSATVYYGLSCLPIIMTINNKVLKRLIILFVSILLVISNKRTGMIAMIAFYIVYFIVDAHLQGSISKKRKKTLTLLFLLLALYLLVNYVNMKYGIDIISNFIGLAKDGGSNRDVIYSMVIQKISETHGLEKWIGHGFNSVAYSHIAYDPSTAVWTSAHSDLFETIYDYGYFGLFMYLLLLVSIARNNWKLISTKHYLAAPTSGAFVIFLVLSAFSHLLIYQTYVAFFYVLWAYAYNTYDNKENACEEQGKKDSEGLYQNNY